MSAQEDAREELQRIYAQLEGDLAQILEQANALGCRGCGTCCRFPPGGDVLYATAPERELLASVPPHSGAQSEDACPYLRGDSCSARERRTIGCRSHFCPEALPALDEREACHAAGERAYGRLGHLVRELELEWDYDRVVERLRERGVA